MTFEGKNFKFISGEKTYIMGILNVTADSFYDGGKYNSPEKALTHTKEMLENGADIIDIGAQSTRPGHREMTAEEELEILKNYLPLIYNETGAVISVDTFFPEVADFALSNGAAIVNDVSGVVNPKMAEVVKRHNAGWIIMHTGGGDAVNVPDYKTSVTDDVINFFDKSLKLCEKSGLDKCHIALDMGIGFGKTYEQNLELIKNMSLLRRDGVFLLVALSSKRVISNTIGVRGEDLMFGTISANVLSVSGGADMVRVHNVYENSLALKMADAILRG